MRVVKNKLEWDYHELAFSRRTSGFPIIIYDGEGDRLFSFASEKRAGWVELPPGAKYVFRQYRTGSGYPAHELYVIESGGLKLIAEITRFTTPSSVERLSLPEKLREEVIKSL
jgi:hypothetical protein